MNDKLNPNQFGEQFGISEKEQHEMRTRAIGDEIHETLEKAMFGEVGGYKAKVQSEALKRMRGIPANMMAEDENGPHASYTSGGWTTKWWGGAFAEHSHPKHGVVDMTDMSHYTPEGHQVLPSLTGEDIKSAHHDFLKYKKENYPPHMQ